MLQTNAVSLSSVPSPLPALVNFAVATQSNMQRLLNVSPGSTRGVCNGGGDCLVRSPECPGMGRKGKEQARFPTLCELTLTGVLGGGRYPQLRQQGNEAHVRVNGSRWFSGLMT